MAQSADKNDEIDENIRYFWRKKEYKDELLMKIIRELALEDGLSNEVFDFIHLNYESRLESQKNDNSNDSDDNVRIDNISSFLLDLVDAETLFPMPQVPLFEEAASIPQLNNKNYIHLNVDLHGYTQNGARQEVRRVLLNLDRTKKATIKFNVGQGKHSANNKQVLPDIVREVCQSLKFHPPSISLKNPGYLQITIDPIISEGTNDLKD